MGTAAPHGDPKRSRTGRVLLLDDVDTSGSAAESVRSRRLPPLVLLVTALVLPGIIVASIILTTSRADDADTSAAFDPGTEPDRQSTVEGFSGSVEGLSREYSPYSARDGDAIDSVVVGGLLGDRSMFGPAGAVDVLGPGNRTVENLRLDATGNWLAGSYNNGFDQNVLLVAKVQANPLVMEPVAVDVNGWAWHPHEPGVIAFAEQPTITLRTNVNVVDLTATRRIRQRSIADFPGRLRLWGDWGFAFDEPGPVPLTTVALVPDIIRPPASSALVNLVSGVPGRAVGELGTNRILIDGAEAATILNLKTAVFETNVWTEPSGEVYSMAASPDGRYSVALVAGRNGSDDTGGKVLLLAADPETDGGAVDLLFTTSGATAFDWSPDGRFVSGYQPAVLNPDGERVSAASIVVYDLGEALLQTRSVRTIDGTAPDLRFDVETLAFQEAPSD